MPEHSLTSESGEPTSEMTGDQMTLGDYAAVQAAFGAKIIGHANFYWRRVRPLFYRPLLPMEGSSSGTFAKAAVWPSVSQYPVSSLVDANSTLNFLMLYDTGGYSLSGLTHKRRQMITRAAKYFKVRRIMDPQELKDCGHRIYLSFYNRTGYRYKSERRDKMKFEQWVDRLFAEPRAIVMAGFQGEEMGALSTSYWVNHTLVYSTLICESDAMKKNVGEVMLHELRDFASREPAIRQIFVRNYQGGNSIDQYYLLRGCSLVRQPARLDAPNCLLGLLKRLSLKNYQRLVGHSN